MRITRRQLRRIIREAVGAASSRRRARRISESSYDIIEPSTKRRLEQDLMRAFQEAAGEGAYPEALRDVTIDLANEWLESYGTSSPSYVPSYGSGYPKMDRRVKRKFMNAIEHAFVVAGGDGAYPEAIFNIAERFAEEWLASYDEGTLGAWRALARAKNS